MMQIIKRLGRSVCLLWAVGQVSICMAVDPQTTVQPSTVINYLISNSGSTAGQIVMFAGNYAPTGTFLADGSTKSLNEYNSLYEQIGDTYGASTATGFVLPDLRGKVAIGTGAGPGLTARNLGDQTGSYETILTAAQMPTSVGGGGGTLTNMQLSLALNMGIATTGIYYPQTSGTVVGGGEGPMWGQVIISAAKTLPSPFLAADGRTLDSNQFPVLHHLIGNTYGGSGDSFNLPDLRGRAVLGANTSTTLGVTAGSETTSIAVENLPAPEGVSAPYSNQQPTMTLNYLIAYEGVFPQMSGGTSVMNNDQPFIGQIALFSGSLVPTGWMLSEGQLLSTDLYMSLFSVIGYQYGGSGSTFALPDLRNGLVMGAGNGYTVGQKVGQDPLTLSANQVPEVVPEPSTWLLLIAAGLGWLLVARRGRQKF